MKGKKKLKTRSFSIGTKLVVPSVLLIMIVCGFLGSTLYNRSKADMVRMGIEQAKIVATFASKSVDTKNLSGITPGKEDSEEYRTICDSLTEVKKGFSIAYLYTLYQDGSKICYGVDTDPTEEKMSIGDEFSRDAKYLATVLGGECQAENEIDDSDGEALITAYMPLKDSEGNMVGILGCDYDASMVTKQLLDMKIKIIQVCLACMVIGMLALSGIIMGITRNLRRVDDKIYELAYHEGDLTQKVEVKSGDELERIANNVNALLNHIREIMLKIQEHSANLKKSSKNVVERLDIADGNITDVSATMEEMSAGMEEVMASISQINESIQSVFGQIENISDNAVSGNELAVKIQSHAVEIRDHAIEAKEAAKEKTEQIARLVNEKIEKSRAVEEISVLSANIISITEQTNLLALNASIEAARAGEAGRGFAVVADEIGKLAANSSDTASKIETVSAEVITAVNELSREAEEMIQFMENTAMDGYQQLVEMGGKYREEAASINQMMENFAEKSENVTENMESIKEAMAAVNIAMDESTRGIMNVSEMSVELSAGITEIGQTADLNLEIADALLEEVGKFRLE